MIKLFQTSHFRKQNDSTRKNSKEKENRWSRDSFPQNDVILRRLFGMLRCEDLKTCRLVCSKWESISKSFFIRQSRIVLEVPLSSLSRKNSIEQDLKLVLENVGGLQRITTFAFRGYFPCSLLTQLTDKKILTITALYIDGLKLIDDDGKILKRFDCSCLLSPSIRELYINSKTNRDGLPETHLYVQSGSLISLEKLYLKNCVVVINEMIKMCPRELTLKLVSFARNIGPPFHQILLNEFFNFDRINKLTIWGSFTDSVWEYSTNRYTMTIDLGETVQVDTLELYRTQVLNWSTAKWKVESFIFYDCPFENPTTLTFKMLVSDSIVNLDCLPLSIERLVLKECRLTQNDEDKFVVLPNLKYLHWEGPADSNILRRFSRCPTLTDLEVGGIATSQLLWLQNVPKTVKRMKMKAYTSFNVSPSTSPEELRLDTLILQGFDKWETIENILYRIKSNSLFFVNDHQKTLLAKDKIMQTQFVRFAIGLNESHFVSFTDLYWDQGAKCYLFENEMVGSENEGRRFEGLIRLYL